MPPKSRQENSKKIILKIQDKMEKLETIEEK